MPLDYRLKADDAGQFEIAFPLDRYELMVASREGFADIERDASQIPGEIRLKKWASVTGRLLQSGKPVPNCAVLIEPIRIGGPGQPRNMARLSTMTGEDG